MSEVGGVHFNLSIILQNIHQTKSTWSVATAEPIKKSKTIKEGVQNSSHPVMEHTGPHIQQKLHFQE